MLEIRIYEHWKPLDVELIINVTELLTSPTLNFWLHFNLRGWSWNGWFWFITGKSETIKSTLKLSTWHHVRALIHCDLWIYLKQLHVFFPWVAHKKGEEKSWRQRVDKWQTGSSPNFCIHFFCHRSRCSQFLLFLRKFFQWIFSNAEAIFVCIV